MGVLLLVVVVVVMIIIVGGGGGGAVGLEDGEDFGLGEVEAEGLHGDFEFVVVDFVVLVQVEEVELSQHSTSVLHILSVYSAQCFQLFISSSLLVYSFLSSPPSPVVLGTARVRARGN